MADVRRDDEIHGDQVRGDGQPAGAQPRRRTRNQGRRNRTVRFALTDTEYAELSDAARHAGLARGAYAAEAALSVARGVVVTPDAPLRDAFYALDRAALLVRKIGINLNQAVKKLNATGQWSGDLVPYAQESDRCAARLEAAGEDLRKRFLRAIRAPGPRGPRSPDRPLRPRMTGWHPAPARMAFRAPESAWPRTAGIGPVAFPASGTGRDSVPVVQDAGMAPGRPGGRGVGLTSPMPLAGDR